LYENNIYTDEERPSLAVGYCKRNWIRQEYLYPKKKH